MRTLILGGAAVAAGLCMVGSAAAAVNLVTNGSFEDGTFGWLRGGEAVDGFPAAIITTDGVARNYPLGAFGEAVAADNAAGSASPDAAGSHAAYFVSDFSTESLSQAVTLAPGHYRVGFDAYVPLNGLANLGDGVFSGTVGGQNLVFASVKNSADFPPGAWKSFFTDFDVSETATPSTIFSFRTDQYPSDDIIVDRVYITAVADAGVPEPASWALMIAGFGGVGRLLRARRKLALA